MYIFDYQAVIKLKWKFKYVLSQKWRLKVGISIKYHARYELKCKKLVNSKKKFVIKHKSLPYLKCG